MQHVDANLVVSISDLKKSPTNIITESQGQPVAVLNHNRVVAYMLAPETYEAMLERLDDLDLIEIIKSRRHETGVPVDIDAL